MEANTASRSFFRSKLGLKVPKAEKPFTVWATPPASSTSISAGSSPLTSWLKVEKNQSVSTSWIDL